MEVRSLKMSVTLSDFPMSLLDDMKQELHKYTKCEIKQSGTEVQISCTADMVKCMEVVAIADKYNFRANGGNP